MRFDRLHTDQYTPRSVTTHNSGLRLSLQFESLAPQVSTYKERRPQETIDDPLPCPSHPPGLDYSNHEAPRYAAPEVEVTLRLTVGRSVSQSVCRGVEPSSVQISSSAPCSQTPSVYVPSLMSETKFNTRRHTNKTICVVSTTDPQGRIVEFLDRGLYFFFQVAPQLYSRG
jgi:hypothetical protein